MTFSEKKIIAIAREINNPIILLDSKRLQLLQLKIKKNLGEEVFGIEEKLKIIYKNKEKLRRLLNKEGKKSNTLQTYLDMILGEFNLKVKFNGLYLYVENNGIKQVEDVIIDKKEEILKELRKTDNKGSGSNKMILPIYKVIIQKNQSNIKGYLSVDIVKGDYKKIFFILNVIFWNIQDIINELFEEKYQNIRKKFMLDQLTKAYTRQCFYLKLKNDLLNKKEKEEIYIMFVDIDNFSKINNIYGHDVGDEILKSFVSGIENNIKSGIDYIGRWGGEEFVIVLNFDKATIKDKNHIKKIILEKVNNIKKEIKKSTGKNITFSGGVVSTDEIKNYKEILKNENNINKLIEQLIKIADTRMYEAKKTGKDKIIFEDFNNEYKRSITQYRI